MRTRSSLFRLLLAVLVGSWIGAGTASAVSFPADVYTFPVTDGVDLPLGTVPGATMLMQLNPGVSGPQDVRVDIPAGFQNVRFDPSNSNVILADLTFEIEWLGTIDLQTPGSFGLTSPGYGVFTVIDSRQNDSPANLDTLDDSVDIPNSGIVRGSFSCSAGVICDPLVVQDDLVSGLVQNTNDDGDTIPNEWLGFAFDMGAGTQTISMTWALDGALPIGGSSNEIFLPSAVFTALPEPGAGLLALTAVAGLAALRGRAARRR